LAAENCGAVAPQALVKIDRFAVWWGDRSFWLYDGTVQKLTCEVIDFLFEDLDQTQVSKIQAFTNSEYDEIWWLYQSAGSTTGEVDSYVFWNYRLNSWYTGRLNRTAGLDSGVLQTPIMITPDGELFNHELEDTFPDGNVFVASGTINAGQGERNMAVRRVYPDVEGSQTLTVSLLGRQFPNTPEFTYGPYNFHSPIVTRAMGRSIRLQVNFQEAGDEWGDCRLDFTPVGTGER
jgi:hypothetical protein